MLAIQISVHLIGKEMDITSRPKDKYSHEIGTGIVRDSELWRFIRIGGLRRLDSEFFIELEHSTV